MTCPAQEQPPAQETRSHKTYWQVQEIDDGVHTHQVGWVIAIWTDRGWRPMWVDSRKVHHRYSKRAKWRETFRPLYLSWRRCHETMWEQLCIQIGEHLP